MSRLIDDQPLSVVASPFDVTSPSLASAVLAPPVPPDAAPPVAVPPVPVVLLPPVPPPPPASVPPVSTAPVLALSSLPQATKVELPPSERVKAIKAGYLRRAPIAMNNAGLAPVCQFYFGHLVDEFHQVFPALSSPLLVGNAQSGPHASQIFHALAASL